MGVYVKEMKIPPTCGFCKLAWCCKASEGEAVDLRMRNSNRHPNCPLVEVKAPHGRLIDESVLNERAKLWVTNFNLGTTLYEQLDEFYKVAEIPTVIEAEVE